MTVVDVAAEYDVDLALPGDPVVTVSAVGDDNGVVELARCGTCVRQCPLDGRLGGRRAERRLVSDPVVLDQFAGDDSRERDALVPYVAHSPPSHPRLVGQRLAVHVQVCGEDRRRTLPDDRAQRLDPVVEVVVADGRNVRPERRVRAGNVGAIGLGPQQRRSQHVAAVDDERQPAVT